MSAVTLALPRELVGNLVEIWASGEYHYQGIVNADNGDVYLVDSCGPAEPGDRHLQTQFEFDTGERLVVGENATGEMILDLEALKRTSCYRHRFGQRVQYRMA